MKGTIGKLFLDSGAFSLYMKEGFAKRLTADHHAFYKTSEFKKWVDDYAAFVKRFQPYVDYYANMDAILNPAISWQVLKYLENEHGLTPMPVVHQGTKMKWLDKYIEAGYNYIGLGGLVKKGAGSGYTEWLDSVFAHLGRNTNGLPIVKTHGFAATSWKTLVRYPWYSVDSASWAKGAGYGFCYLPHKRNGEFTFAEQPYIVTFTTGSKNTKKRKIERDGLRGHLGLDDYSKQTYGRSYHAMPPTAQKVICEWLAKFALTPEELAVSCRARCLAFLKYFECLAKSLPEWPWPFRMRSPRPSFNLGG